MLTLFTTPKPFHGCFGVIQRNALASWMRLRPACDVIVFGSEDGAAAAAGELGCRHVAEVPRNEFGMPQIRGLFDAARRVASTPVIGYVNADIILMNDFAEAVRRLATLADRFLMLGQRHDLDIDGPLAFDAGWDARLRARIVDRGITQTFGMDYFVFPRDLWPDIPIALAVGRAGWDNWPVYAARLRKAITVDATQTVLAVHQSHDYSHHPDGIAGVYGGVEGDRNYAALGGARNRFTLLDTTHLLTEDGLKVRCRSCYPVCVCKPSSF
jgi:hypothetical protein